MAFKVLFNKNNYTYAIRTNNLYELAPYYAKLNHKPEENNTILPKKKKKV